MAKRRAKRGYFSQINVIPFVDVTLVLLVIFMAAMPMLVQGLKVDLPWTRTVEAVPPGADHVVITVRKDGQIFLEELPLTIEELPEHLRALAGDKLIYVRADKELSYGALVRVLDEVKGCGMETVHLVTENLDGGDMLPAAGQTK